MCTGILLPREPVNDFSFDPVIIILGFSAIGYLLIVVIGKLYAPLSGRAHSFSATVISALIGSLGMAFSSHILLPHTVAVTLFLLSAFFFSLGNALLLIMWGELWSKLATGRAGRHLYISYLFAFVLFFLINSLPLPIAVVIITALPAISAGILKSAQSEPKRKAFVSGHEFEPISKTKILVSILMLNIVWGFFQGILSFLNLGPLFTNHALLFAGICLAALVLNLVIFKPEVEAFVLYRPIVPAMVSGLILFAILPIESAFFGDGLVILGGYCLDILIMLVSCDIAFRTRTPVAFVFGISIFTARLGSLIGTLVCSIFSVHLLAFTYESILMCALIVMLVGTLTFSTADMQRLYQTQVPLNVSNLTERNSILVARQCGLTPREEEVLILLAHGRSAPYIGQELSIAPGTVKRHISNIYRKIGVGDRQSLHDVIEQNRST